MASHLPPPPPPPSSSAPLPPPPPPPRPPAGPSKYATLVAPPAGPAPRDGAGWAAFLIGIAVTLALVVAITVAWPDDEAPESIDAPATPTTLMTAEAAAAFTPPPFVPARPDLGPTTTTIAVDLFAEGPARAVQEVLGASGSPTQLIQITIYPTYLFVAYRDPVRPDAIDRRQWRSGNVAEPEPNPIDDRVDAGTTPQLFALGEVDLSRIPALVADASTRYPEPVEITHIIVDRFLPFDDRVLVRVYAQPVDGGPGGGYTSYAGDGTFVKVCC